MSKIKAKKKPVKYRSFLVRIPVTHDPFFGPQIPCIADVKVCMDGLYRYTPGVKIKRIPEKVLK